DPKAKCPICGMDLVPVMKRQSVGASERERVDGDHAQAPPHSDAPDAPTLFTIPPERQQQIVLTYATVTNHPFALSVRAVGTLAYNKQRHWDYVARVDGYIQNLSVFSRGELVEKDAPLLTLYSPDLLTTQNEFLDVLKTRDDLAKKGDRTVLESTQ